MAITSILINAAQEEELRIAIVDENNKIQGLIFEHPGKEERIHNIYKGIVTGIEPSLHAVFVNYGSEKHGFLPIKDISPLSLYQKTIIEGEDAEKQVASEDQQASDDWDEDASPSSLRAYEPEVRIEDIKVGQEIIVQLDKEERGNKGAALTGYLSLAGRYLVLMPGSTVCGVSRRVEGADRNALKELLKQLNKPKGTGVIMRTSAVGKTLEEVQWDLDTQQELWRAIEEKNSKQKAPFLIFQESDIVNRIIRDHLSVDVNHIIVDNLELYEKIKESLKFVLPNFLEKLVFYSEKLPIFSNYGIENQIDQVYQTSVRLPSGGSIVIHRTEALFSIDVNSARATRGTSIEETAFQINLEAANEIARQLRLRDIGGLIVIDFIDMSSVSHQKEVETTLRNALRADRARVQIGRISRFGLLEMSRQRLKSSLSEETQIVCSHCKGEGHVRSVQSIALSILRVIEEDAIKGQITKIQLQVPVDMAAFFLNEKRHKLVELEEKYHVKVIVLPNLNLHSPHYHIKREKTSIESETGYEKSHESLAAYEEINLPKTGDVRTSKQIKPAVEFTVSRPAPVPASGLFGFLKRRLFGPSSKPKNQQNPLDKPYQRQYKSDSSRVRKTWTQEGDEQGRRQGGSDGGGQQPKRTGGRGRYYRGRSRKPMS